MKKLVLILCLACLASTPTFAEVAGIVKDLVALRAELETLNREMEIVQKERRDELDLWVQKKLELESALQKESLRHLQLQEKIQRLVSRVKAESQTNPRGKRELLEWITSAKAWLDSAVPFRREQRLQVLHSLQERVERGMESLESLSAELWMFYENEFKMAADNEFRITDLNTPKGQQPAEVVRLGLFALFARTVDGQIQQTVYENGKWSMKPLNGRAKQDVVRLIENMKAKKETGLYSLPLSSPKESL